MEFGDIKFDCKHFVGGRPCNPHKELGVTCNACDHYQPITKRILIIKLDLIGDVLRTTPILRKYRSYYPNAHITWITNAPQLLPKSEIDSILAPSAISNIWLQCTAFDIAVNLDKAAEACMILTAARSTKKFGFIWKNGHIDVANEAAKHKILTGLSDTISKQNRKSYQREIFEICEMPFNNEEYLIARNPSITKHWRSEIMSRSENKVVVGLNPGCGEQWRARLWPKSNWLALIQELKAMGYFCVLLGGPAEERDNLELATATGAYFPGVQPLLEFSAIVNSCEKVVTSVTLSLHVAIALRKEIVLLNNIFNPHEFELYDRGVILEPKLGCQCFYSDVCEVDQNCMQQIKVEEVIGALKAQILADV